MKNCWKCGQELPDEAKFCLECGASQADGAEEAEAHAAAAQAAAPGADPTKCTCACSLDQVKKWFTDGGPSRAFEKARHSPQVEAAQAKLKEAAAKVGPKLKEEAQKLRTRFGCPCQKGSAEGGAAGNEAGGEGSSGQGASCKDAWRAYGEKVAAGARSVFNQFKDTIERMKQGK